MSISFRQVGGTICVGAAMVLLFAGNVLAQTQPAGSEYRPGGYPESYRGTFYPGTELRALPPARAQASAAAAEYRRAQSNLSNAIETHRRAHLRSAELNEAMAAEREAYEALTAARERALANLRNDANYQAAVDLRSQVGNQIHNTRTMPRPADVDVDMDRVLALATLKMSYSSTASAMEAAAVSANSDVREARQRLVNAGRRLSELRMRFEDSVRDSDAVLAARKSVGDARVAMVATSAMYSEARTVAQIALNYAYDLYAQPMPYVINGPYYGSIYGGYPAVGYPVGYPYVGSTIGTYRP